MSALAKMYCHPIIPPPLRRPSVSISSTVDVRLRAPSPSSAGAGRRVERRRLDVLEAEPIALPDDAIEGPPRRRRGRATLVATMAAPEAAPAVRLVSRGRSADRATGP